jgi:hypothetical protein
MNDWAIRAMRRTKRITGRARIENTVYKWVDRKIGRVALARSRSVTLPCAAPVRPKKRGSSASFQGLEHYDSKRRLALAYN